MERWYAAIILRSIFRLQLHCLDADKNRKKGFKPELQAANGKKSSTQLVISRALEEICKQVLEAIEGETGEKYKVSDIQWVLTVPAIWSHQVCVDSDSINSVHCQQAKLVMRRAALDAKMVKTNAD